MRAGNHRRVESCARNGKSITSFAAIVAPQSCTLVRDASVLVAPARPAHSENLSDLLSSSSLALAKVFFLVGLSSCNVLSCPAPMLPAVHSDFFRRGNLSVNLPTEQRHPMNSHLAGRFLRRIRLTHLCYTPITYVVKQKTNPDRHLAPIRAIERISQNIVRVVAVSVRSFVLHISVSN
jgi:hypothetical protein